MPSLPSLSDPGSCNGEGGTIGVSCSSSLSTTTEAVTRGGLLEADAVAADMVVGVMVVMTVMVAVVVLEKQKWDCVLCVLCVFVCCARKDGCSAKGCLFLFFGQSLNAFGVRGFCVGLLQRVVFVFCCVCMYGWR